MSRLLAGLALAITASLSPAGAPIEWVFDSALPPGAIHERASTRLDDSGATLPANTPLFSQRLWIPEGAQKLVSLDPQFTVLESREIAGTRYSIVRDANKVFLTTASPDVTDPLARIDPDPANNSKFGTNAEWGQPASAEIYPDGTILIHTSGSQPENRSRTIRTTVTVFDLPGGMALVRTSDYNPPPGEGTTQSPPWFTRTSYLPNLDLWVSSIVEYRAEGLASSTFPGDGRSIGYVSTDTGQTWVRVIDTDDPNLGRNLVVTAKHVHHIEPFEWFDELEQDWNIGAIACLGDGLTASGPILVFGDGTAFPDPDLGNYPTLQRRKSIGRDMLTDLYPTDPSIGPDDPLVAFLGPDTAQSGIIRTRIDLADQHDEYLFRPSSTFIRKSDTVSTIPDIPFIFQLRQLPNGSFAAPTMENFGGASPNGILISDPTGDHWVTARQVTHKGYTGVIPIAPDQFWSFDRGALQLTSELWQVPAPILESPIHLGVAAHSALPVQLFADNTAVSRTDVSGSIPLPEELPPNTNIFRVSSGPLPPATTLDDQTAHAPPASPGQLVSFVFWIKPASTDIAVVDLQLRPVFNTAAGETETGVDRLRVDVNDWTRVICSRRVPESGFDSIELRITPLQNTNSTLPLDYFVTQPLLAVSDQPLADAPAPNQATDADRLTIPLPPMGTEWSVQFDITEQLAIAASLIDDADRDITLLDKSLNTQDWQGVQSSLELRTNIDAVDRFPVESDLHDVFLPTLSRVTIVMSQPGDVLKLYVQRGMGDTQGTAMPAAAFSPTRLQFGTPDWSRVTQGALHRVRVWPDEALDLGPAEFIDPCPQDVNADGARDVNDISFVLFRLGNSGDPGTLEGDANNDGVVDVNDISAVLFNFGPCPAP